MDFSQLISPFSMQDFKDNYLEKSVCFASRRKPEFYEDLVDHRYLRLFLLNGGFKASECRLIKENSDLSPYLYASGHRKKASFTTADTDRYVDAVKVMNLYAEGYSISLMEMDRHHPSLAVLKNQLMADLRAHISVNLYASPDKSTGLPPHTDPHDVLILQIYGKKRWQVFDKETALPLPGQADADPVEKPEVESFVLEQGDFAYIPRGFTHRATTFDGSSIHLTIAITYPTYFDVFQNFIKQLSITDREMRSSLRTIGKRENAGELLERLGRILGTPESFESMKRSLDSIEKQLIDAVSPVHQLGVETIDFLHGEFCLSSRLKVTNPAFVKIQKSNGISTLLYPGQNLAIHPLLEPLVLSIVERKNDCFRLDAVIGPSKQEAQIQFLKFLIKEGFLRIVRDNDA